MFLAVVMGGGKSCPTSRDSSKCAVCDRNHSRGIIKLNFMHLKSGKLEMPISSVSVKVRCKPQRY